MSATPREHTRTYYLGKLATELEERGLTALLRSHPPALRISHPDTFMLAETVDKEFTTIEDVADVALFLATFKTNALTGQSICVSHGWHMS